MRQTTLFAFALLTGSMLSAQDLIISEVVDATQTGGLPKFVELTNIGNTPIDLSGFSLGNQNNADTEMGNDALVLSGILAAGDSHVVSYENSNTPGSSTFFTVYGFDADDLTPGSFINGDDRIILFQGAALATDPCDGTGAPIVDMFGEDGVDGSGTAWEYMDSWAVRNPLSSPNGGVFNAAEWTFGGANALDGASIADIVNATSPGTHDAGITAPTSVPAAGTWSMILMALGLAGTAFLTIRKRI